MNTFQSIIKDDPSKNSTEKPPHRSDYFKILLTFGVYFTILTVAFLYEISYKSPILVNVFVKNTDIHLQFTDETVQIPTINRIMFFVEVFIGQISAIPIAKFILGFLEEYPRISKIVMSLMFFSISHITTISVFPYENESSQRAVIASIVGIVWLVVAVHIAKNKQSQPSSIVRIAVKSILAALILLIILKIQVVAALLPISTPIEIYLKDKPHIMDQIRNSCKKIDFDPSNICVFKTEANIANIFALSLFCKRFNYIFLTQYAAEKCPGCISGALYHEIVHTYFIDFFVRFSFFLLIFFTVFFFSDRYIIPNLNNYGITDYAKQGIRMATILKLIEYGGHIAFTLLEERCDSNVIAHPENAVGCALFLCISTFSLFSLSRNFRSANFASSRYSFFNAHPPTLERLLRISRECPELIDVEMKFRDALE